MAMLYRVGSNRLRHATLLISTRLSGIPTISPSPVIVNSSNPSPVYAAPNLSFFQHRSFAAPVQAKSKTKASESTTGPRVNGAITAPVIRLVTEDGHDVISLKEALDRARQLDLDLVEVQRNAKPPVCKIMDFHKEKYKKEIMEKERAKTKSALSLKSGGNKEVRFKAKTELKDLKVKADGITRLMERGYRVKCTALPCGNQVEDLGEHLSRLLALIEDVSFVESGPHVDSKQAYAIVRHVKFETKKSGKKKVADSTKALPPPKSVDESDETWECDSASDDENPANPEIEQIPQTPVMDFERLNKFDHRPAHGSVTEEPPKPVTNRYALPTEPQKNPASNQPIAPNNYRDHNSRENPFYQGRVTPSNSTGFHSRDAFHRGHIAPNTPRDFNNRDGFNQGRMAMNNRDGFNQGRMAMNNRDGFNQGRMDLNNSWGNNSRNALNQGQDQYHNREKQFQPSNQTLRAPVFGQFPKEGQPPVNHNPGNGPNSHQKSFGVINMPENNAIDDNSSPPRPKFGFFNSSSKSTESSEKTGSADSSTPMPNFGIFNANRTNVPNNQR